jgi:hypothetical protein
MSLLRLWGCLAVRCQRALPTFLAAIGLILTTASASVAAQDPKAKLPPELAVIPQGSFAFLYLRPAELWQSDPVAKLRKMFPQEAEQLLKSLDGDPLDTESLTIVYPSPDSVGFLPSPESKGRFKTRGRIDPDEKVPLGELQADLPKKEPGGIHGMLLIETTVKPVTQAYVLEHVLGKGAVANKHGPRTFFKSKGPEAVYFVNERTYVFAFTTEAMKWMLTKLDDPRTRGSQSVALDRAAQKRHVVLGLNTDHPGADALRRELSEDWRIDRGPLPTWAMVPLLEMRSAVFALDVGKELKLDAELRFPDAKSAAKASGALEDALFLGRFMVPAFLRSERRLEMPGREEGRHLSLTLGDMLLPQLEKSLRRAAVEQRQEVLHLQAGAILNFESLQGLSFHDDFAVIHVRVADLMRTEFASELVKVFPNLVLEEPFRKLEEVGLPVNAIESATVVLPTSQNMFGPFGVGREIKEPKKAVEIFEEKKFDPPPIEKPKQEKELEKSIPQEFDLPDKKDPDLKSSKVLFRAEAGESFVTQPVFDGDDREVVIVKVTTIRPYDRKKIMRGILGNAPKEMKHRGKTYFVRDSSRERLGMEALHFVDERTVLIAPDFAMGRVLDRPALFRAKGPFADAVEAAKKKHPFVFAANLTEASVLRAKQEIAAALSGVRGRPDSLEAELGRALLPLIEARSFIVSADEETGLGGKEMRVQADVTFADAGQAATCKEAAQDALTLGRLFLLSRGRMELRRLQVENILRDDFDAGPIVFGNRVLVPGEKPVLVPRRDLQPPLVGAALLAQAEGAVRQAKIQQRDATLRAVAQGRFDLKELQAQAREDAVALVKNDTSDRLMRKSMTNMRRLVVAMHAFNEVHGKFPASGNLSWRVHLLPFMDELGLYKEFKQNEPWDSPHNIKLLPRMPKIFAAPGIKTKEPYTTHYQLMTGPDTVSDVKAKTRIFDGIVIVEASDPTPWTKPTDLVYDAKKPLPKLGGIFQDGFHAIDISGNANFWPRPLDEANFRARIIGNRAARLPGQRFDK